MTYPLQTAQQQNNGHSGAFHNDTIEDPIRAITIDEAKTISEASYSFTTPADPTLTIGALSFFFRCSPSCDQLWLSLKTTSSGQSEWLTIPAYIEALQSPDWFHVSDGEYFIFQKPIRHATITNVLQSQDYQHLIVDDHLIEALPPGITASPVSQLSALAPEMTVITRYQPVRKKDDWFVFEKQIDFTYADISGGTYTWKVDQLGNVNRIDLARFSGQRLD